MQKSTSIIAALSAGKLPSTQQFNASIDYLEHLGLIRLKEVREKVAPKGEEEEAELSTKGQVLADDLRNVLRADQKLLNDKNADNILQEAIWHFSQGTITTSTSKATAAAKQGAQEDIEAVRRSVHTLFGALSHSFVSEGSTLLSELLSLVRTVLSDAFETLEGRASLAKEGLRRVQGEVQEGKRDQWGRDKERLEEEKDPKVAWEHGAESVKGMGASMIGGVQGAQERLGEGKEKAEGEVKGRYYTIWQHAQSDPEYREALNTLFSILQARLHSALDKADKNIPLSTFIKDPTPEQHISKGLKLLRTFLERVAGKSLEPLIDSVRAAMAQVVQDERLRVWFDEFFDYSKKALGDVHYAHSDEAKATRQDLRGRWNGFIENNKEWDERVKKVKTERAAFEHALKNDEDLKAVRDSKKKLSEDLKTGLRARVAGRVEQALEEITWFWGDLFKFYLPNVLGQLRDVPIPRTEYKDESIEFVLENLDISQLNVLPSRVYIRNITDIAIQTFEDPAVSARRQLATLTHIQIQAVQMDLKDLSFWYKDKRATLVGEFTGLLEMKLPPQGINVDLQVRLIPDDATRAEQKRFHVVERCAVEISDEVEVVVKESNHPVLVNVFSGVVKRRIKEAMERTLTEQFRGVVDWVDGVAYDVGERKKVFEDVGLGGGPAAIAALWSELGRIERESEEGGRLGAKATGTGIIFEKPGKEKVLAIGVEPQVLSGAKRGPLGTGSESVKESVQRALEEMDVDVEGLRDRVEAGRGRVEGFRNIILTKEEQEKKSVGKTWRSDAFDL